MTTDTSKADKRGVEYMYIDYNTWLSRPILVGDPPKEHEVEYVHLDLFDAMQARHVSMAEAENERLRSSLHGLANWTDALLTAIHDTSCDPDDPEAWGEVIMGAAMFLEAARAALERKEGM